MSHLTLREAAQLAYHKAPPTVRFIGIFKHPNEERAPQFVTFLGETPPTAETIADVSRNFLGYELVRVLDLGKKFDEQWPAELAAVPKVSALPPPAHPMERLLDHLIASRCPPRATADGTPVDASVDPPAFQGQITFFAGGTMGGSIAKSPTVPGIYRMLSPALRKDEHGRTVPMFVETFFAPAAIANISIERDDLKDEIVKMGITMPGDSRIVAPGRT